MRLPKDLLSGNYKKSRIFLCEPNKEKICQLDTSNTQGTFKFNGLSELSFDVARTYNDLLTGEIKINPYYDKIEAIRLIYVEGIGYFELQAPELVGDGIKEIKSCTAYSLEYVLSQKYLEDFYINTGKTDSVEVIYAGNNHIVPVSLYNPSKKGLSLLHLILEKVYGWTIGHVDSSLQKLCRSFEVDRQSVYDFLMNEVCQKFNCYIVFDTVNSTINIYAESLTSKFIGNGSTKIFTISPPFAEVKTVSVGGYKTTKWTYNASTGVLTLNDAPASGEMVEVVDGALTQWETDVFVTYDNLSREIKIDYDADSIKTVLTVSYGDDENIREVNLGLPYITDLSYYYNPEWMGQDLYEAYGKYLQKSNQHQNQYTSNSQKMVEFANYIDFEENRLSLQYSLVNSVNEETIGTYYVRGGTSPNYYYVEVSLPTDYNANVDYYSMNTTNLNEEKVSDLYTVLKLYFNNEDEATAKHNGWETEYDSLRIAFEFMKTEFNELFFALKSETGDRTTSYSVEAALLKFFKAMWREIGRTPLKALYYEPYKKVQITNMEAGWSNKSSVNYGYYYPVVILLKSIEKAIAERDVTINSYQQQYKSYQNANIVISNDMLLSNNFTPDQLVKLNAFLREDEVHYEDIVSTGQDSIADTFKVKQDAMESGRIELQKLCQPQLQFAMSMANIYALPEFEPIIEQFQLGNMIKVGIRPDYIKQSRLLQVNINFDDFSDFSCEFGDLVSLRTQSDIHADLLKNALSAGKSVASNASYWTKGSDKANNIDLRLEEGLLNSIEALKSIDGTQNAYIDKYGIHLEVVNPETGEVGDKRVWMVNNQIVFTDDGFKTSKSVLGEFTIDGVSYYGLLAQAVIAGLVEGSEIKGGTIQIGEYIDDNGDVRYAFEVTEDGVVKMHAGGNTIDGYATTDDLQSVKNEVDAINSSKMYKVEIVTDSSTVISTATDKATLTCRVYSWDTDITNTLDASYFDWKRISTNASQDAIWNAMPEHQNTKSITIDADDVVGNSSFICEVDLPESQG